MPCKKRPAPRTIVLNDEVVMIPLSWSTPMNATTEKQLKSIPANTECRTRTNEPGKMLDGEAVEITWRVGDQTGLSIATFDL
jgi:hypothetical protein